MPLWEECSWVTGDIVDDLMPSDDDVIFKRSHSINRRIYLHCGKIYKLPTDVMIVGQNDSLNSVVDDLDAIYALAGPQLEEELSLLAPIETGDSVLTKGYMLPCSWLIHAVGPKYDQRYLTASDHALFSAYQSSLIKAAEKSAKSVVINCLYLSDKRYPRFEAAHVALRTVRKFLEHGIGGGFERLMFCVPTQDDYEIYSALLSAYFPRNIEEESNQANLLPLELGDEWGSIVVPDRVLKVSAGPKPMGPRKSIDPEVAAAELGSKYKTGDRQIVTTTEEQQSTRGMYTSTTYGIDEDDVRRQQRVRDELAKLSREEVLRMKFQSLLDDVEEEDYEEEMEAMNFLSVAGEDKEGRAVILISAANLHRITTEEQQDHVLLYFMKILEPFRCKPFVLVYAQSGVTDDNTPDMVVVQTIFDLFTARYVHQILPLYSSFSVKFVLNAWIYRIPYIPYFSNPIVNLSLFLS